MNTTKFRNRKFVSRTSSRFVSTLPNTTEGHKVFEQLKAATSQSLKKQYRGGIYSMGCTRANGWSRKNNATRFDVYFLNPRKA